MNNIEYALITQILRQQNFHTLQKLQVDESYFSAPEAKELYRFIRDTYTSSVTSGQVPSEEMARTRFPSFYFVEPKDSVAMLCQQLRRDRLQVELLKLSEEIKQLADTDPSSAIAALRTETSKLASLSEAGQDLNMSSIAQVLKERYDVVQSSQGMLGIPYPWDPLNEETQGMQGSQFIVIYGRPKQMKSWIAMDIAVHAYVHSRKRVLFYTREMNPLLVAQRIACLITKVNYKAFKSGKLQPEVKAMVFQILDELLHDEKGIVGNKEASHPACFVITTDRSAAVGGSGGGVGWLQAKIRDIKPDLVVVDGMYLMNDDRSGRRTVDWKAVAHISQDLKGTSQDFDIPLIGVTQANRSADKSTGEDMTELAYADALGQDADAVFRVRKKIRIDDTNQKHTEVHITSPGMREGVFDGIVIHGEPATDFSYIRTLVDVDAEQDGYGEGKPKGGSNGVHKPFKASLVDPKIPVKTIKGAV